ncbi:MAG: hypothetical protein JXQ74_01385 [Alphaproteobacteria bacterium]|nr:hypothetical protein [Alphaproteobacteria bacterium]
MLKKLFFLGIPLGILTALIGWATCGNLFNWIYQIDPTYIWLSPLEMNIPLIWGSSIISAMIMVFAFGVVKDKMSQKCRIARGLSFGLLIWLVAIVPTEMSAFLYTVTADEVILYHLILGLVMSVLQGIFISVLYDEALPLGCCSDNCKVAAPKAVSKPVVKTKVKASPKPKAKAKVQAKPVVKTKVKASPKPKAKAKAAQKKKK